MQALNYLLLGYLSVPQFTSRPGRPTLAPVRYLETMPLAAAPSRRFYTLQGTAIPNALTWQPKVWMWYFLPFLGTPCFTGRTSTVPSVPHAADFSITTSSASRWGGSFRSGCCCATRGAAGPLCEARRGAAVAPKQRPPLCGVVRQLAAWRCLNVCIASHRMKCLRREWVW